MQDILLVEDDEATRARLASLLRDVPDLRVAAECATARDALAWLQLHRPDIVLVDLGLPDRPGLDVIREAVKRHPGCDVLVITVFGDAGHVLAAIDAGATGYLLKDSSIDHLGDHLQYLRLGGSPLSPRVARLLIRRQQERTPMAAVSSTEGALLSDRELEVLTGIAKGFSYNEVAGALSISTNTVRTHVRRIY